VADVSAPDRVLECAHRGLDVGLVVPAVDLVEVDDVHPEPVEAAGEVLFDGLPGEPGPLAGGIGLGGHTGMGPGRDDLGVAVVLREDVAEHSLGLAHRVHVGGVEEVDPEVDGSLDEFPSAFLVHHPLAPVTAPEAHTAQTDAADAHARVTEGGVLHAGPFLAGN